MTKTASHGKSAKRAPQSAAATSTGTSKLDTLVTLLRRSRGASIRELAAACSWQPHSVRGALSGTLKKKGHSISSKIVDGTRRYRIEEAKA